MTIPARRGRLQGRRGPALTEGMALSKRRQVDDKSAASGIASGRASSNPTRSASFGMSGLCGVRGRATSTYDLLSRDLLGSRSQGAQSQAAANRCRSPPPAMLISASFGNG
jgi:hypothetical protein